MKGLPKSAFRHRARGFIHIEKEHNMSATIEMVSFKLNDGVSPAVFIKASEELDNWVGQQSGFEYRALAQQEDGTWVDIVFWQSQAHAQQAGDAFMTAKESQNMMACIDKNSVVMQHMPVMASLSN
ncbi:hypothetical protein A9Q81_14915, partial [Gammaproteobacteria bacterium 42_54_T18]